MKSVRGKLLFLLAAISVCATCATSVWAQDGSQSAPKAASPSDPLAAKTPPGMVYVPGGAFIRGTDRAEAISPTTPRSHNDARPQANVEVAAFYIDKTEVTNAEYKKFLDATAYPPPPHWPGNSYTQGEGNVAVTHVDWWEAEAYARWAGKRLPSETEWEKAARGTDGRIFPWGNAWNPGLLVWNEKRAQAVGSRTAGASPYGALDMAGNVYEWTASWYDAYPNAPHHFDDFGKRYRVVRGGGFDGYQVVAETFYRSVAYPTTRSEWLGFRCAVDAK